MKPIVQGLLGVAFAGMFALAGTNLHAQSGSGGAFFAYKEGVTAEQEAEDHAACHEWALAQSGFRPSAAYAAGKSLIAGAGNTLPSDDRRYPAPTGIAAAQSSADIDRLNALYDRYLKAGRICMEGRGYITSS